MQAKTAQVCISDLDTYTVDLLLRYCYGCLQEMPSDHAQVSNAPYKLFGTSWTALQTSALMAEIC